MAYPICYLNKEISKIIHAMHLFLLVHGGWSQWSGYDECSVKCGGGTQKRTRGCNKPEPANGGRDCEGSPTETRSCKVQPCPGMYVFVADMVVANTQRKKAKIRT